MQNLKPYIIFWLFLNLIVASFTAKVCMKWYSYSQNTLYNSGNWHSSKTDLKKGVIGAVAFMVTKVALAGDVLNLGAWHGFQELIYKKKCSPTQIEFDFLLAKTSYFSFFFNKDSQGFHGIRISIDSNYENIFFYANAQRKFIQKKPLNIANLKEETWHHCKITFAKNSLSLYIQDNKIVENIAITLSDKQQFGFRGSLGKTLIDNISITGENQKIEENFSTKEPLKILLLFFLIFALANILIFTLFKDKKLGVFKLLIINMCLIFTAVCGYAYYLLAGSLRYPSKYKTINWHNLKSNIEGKDVILKKIARKYSPQNSKNKKRILFLGSSQTWGAGATAGENTFVARIEQLLNAKGSYECINGGISGSKSYRLIKHYKKSWIKLKPQLVIINLSNNDNHLDRFEKSLEEYILLNKKNNIKTLFILEANATHRAWLASNHDIMRRIAKKHQVPVLDMHKYLQSQAHQGFLWWDIVHLTDFGQKLFAQKAYEKIVEIR